MKTPVRPGPDRHCRQRPTKWLKQRILEEQEFTCLGCANPLRDVEFDHVVPLGLGGANAPDNWAALCPKCHRRKSIADLKRIAKAKRQRRFHETGRSRAPSKASMLGGATGFDRQHRRHMDGTVTNRCACARCAARSLRGGGDA